MTEFSSQLGGHTSHGFSDPRIQLSADWVDLLAQELPTFEAPWSADRAPLLNLSVLQKLADRIRHAVHSDYGLAILLSDGLASLSDGQLAAFHYGVAAQLGRPVGQNQTVDMLVQVSNKSKRGTAGTRGYLDNEAMLLHSDASDFTGLLCLAQADEGGANLFANACMIHDSLAETVPDLLPEYYGDWDWNVGVLGFPLVSEPLRSPIFNVYRGRLYCRYGSSLLRGGARAAGGELNERQLRALEAFEEAMAQDEIVLRHRLKRGEAVWMNNHTLLHGREQFVERDSGETRRRLLRAWTRSTSLSNISPRFRRFDDLLFRGLGSENSTPEPSQRSTTFENNRTPQIHNEARPTPLTSRTR